MSFVKSVSKTQTGNLVAYNSDKNTLIVVSTETQYLFNNMFKGFSNLAERNRIALLRIVKDYCNTPISQREDEKYYLIPIIPTQKLLKPKALYHGISGLVTRDYTEKDIQSKNIDKRYLF